MKKLQKKIRILSLVLIAGFMFYGMMLPVKAYIQKAGTVNEAVTLRQKADSSSNQVMELASGQAVKVNNELKDIDGTMWYQLIVNDTTLGYVPASTVTISDSGTEPQGTTTQQVQTVTVTERIGTVTGADAIRVRQDATTSSEQIASMKRGDTFLVLSDIDTGDGYIWYKVEFDDHGTMVVGHVRSDLVKVEEVTREVEQIIDVPVTTLPEDTTDAPYSISSQVNAEGTTVWYLTDNATGDAKEISSLLNSEPVQKSSNGVYKVFVVILLILVILAAGAATFFYLRWRDAEDFIFELREKQVRAKKQPAPTRTPQANPAQTKQAPQNKSGLGTKPASAATPAGANTVPGTSIPKKPVLTADAVKPAGQTASQQSVKPTGQTAPQQSVKATLQSAVQQVQKTEGTSAVQQPVKPASQAMTQPKMQQPVKPVSQPVKSEVLPNTMDIVKATQQELKNSQAGVNSKPQSGGWKSKNFLTDDDDLEFDFLDMEE